MATPLIKLAELSRALDSLSQEKVRYLCVELGVPPATLSNTDISHPGDAFRRITEYLEALLAYDESLSWERIVEVLNSSRLRQHALAAMISRKYCASYADAADGGLAAPPSLHRRPSLHQPPSPHQPTSPHRPPSFHYPPSPHQPPSLHDPPSPHRSHSDSASETGDPPNNPPPVDKLAFSVWELVEKITNLKKKFHNMLIKANVHLLGKMSQEDFNCFKVDLTTLPMGTTHMLLQNETKNIKEAKSVGRVFEIIDPYWNHVDYELLEHIVDQYCDEGIKRLMESYKRKLHKFEKATPVKNFTSAAVEYYSPPPDYSTLTVTLRMDAEECSLYHVRELKHSMTAKANLQPYIVLLHGLHASSVVLTLAFPLVLTNSIRSALNSEFMKGLGVVPGSLKFNARKMQVHTTAWT